MEILALLISLLSIIISSSIAMWGWWRHRNIYAIEYNVYKPQESTFPGNMELNNKLNSGKYTILHTKEENHRITIILGKIKN